MKKQIIKLLSIICAVTVIICSFAACSDGNPPADTNGGETTAYKISTQKDDVFGDYYNLYSDKITTTAGKTVTVSVTDVWDFLSVENVFANGEVCQKTQDGEYTFTMPEKDVTVTADFKVNIIEERTDGMKWVDADVFLRELPFQAE